MEAVGAAESLGDMKVCGIALGCMDYCAAPHTKRSFSVVNLLGATSISLNKEAGSQGCAALHPGSQNPVRSVNSLRARVRSRPRSRICGSFGLFDADQK